MKALDRFLQAWRIRRAARHLPPGARILDIGCADGALFRLVPGLAGGIGIDEETEPATTGAFRRIRGRFPDDLPESGRFDAATLLAVFEHIPDAAQPLWAQRLRELLTPEGCVILTVPAPAVDRIVDALRALRLLDGMATEQHHAFDPARTIGIFAAAGFRLETHETFQLGLNHLFVFRPAERP